MSKIYLHFTDKTLILDSSENLLYPLQGALLNWSKMRLAFALSLTQSVSDDNAGFSTTERLPISSTLPILNHVSIGLKNRTSFLPGEAGSHFIGLTNHSASNGTSLGTISSVISLSTKDVISFPLTLSNPGVSGYNVTSSPSTVPLATPYDDQGTFYDLPIGQNVVFNGKTVQLAAPVTDGATGISITASPSVNIATADVAGTAASQQVDICSTLGLVIDTNYTTTTTNVASQMLSFPASAVMQGSTNYSTIVVFDFEITNKGTIGQGLIVGYEIHTNQGDTSVTALEAKMSAYSPMLETPEMIYINQTAPNCIFVRWPFTTTRLRIHSMVAKRF